MAFRIRPIATGDSVENGLKCASATSVAQDIVHGIEKGQAVIYTPKKWQLIMLIVRHIPAVIFNKLNI